MATRARRRRLVLWLGVVAAFLTFVGLHLSPLFRVQEVEVVGAHYVDPQEVKEAVKLKSRSIIALPLEDAADRVQGLPMVREASVSLRWPHRLVVQVKERSPWGYWVRQGYAYVVDEDGVVLEGPMPPPGAPSIIETSGVGPLRLGDRVDREAIAVARRLQGWAPAILGTQVASFHYDVQRGLSVVTSEGTTVVVGRAEGLEYKLAVWEALAQKLGPKALAGRMLDLRPGGGPALR
jgi:cell division septal protein FtsQ